MSRESKPTSKINFEASLKKLETIVRKLEDEEIPLDESLKLYAEGKKLAKECETELQAAENRIRQLVEDEEGNVKERELDTDDASTSQSVASSKSTPPSPNAKDDLPF